MKAEMSTRIAPTKSTEIPAYNLGSASSTLCVWKLENCYVVKHTCVTWGVFNDYIMANYMFRPVLAIFRLS